MRQFKIIFYSLYVVLSLGMLFFSVDGLLNMEETRIWLDARIKIYNQIYYAMVIFFLMSMLMVIELTMDYFGMRSLRRELARHKIEITKLKARLYDREPHEDLKPVRQPLKEDLQLGEGSKREDNPREDSANDHSSEEL